MSKHILVLEAKTSLSEMKELFQDTPIARFTFDEANASVICWDQHEVNGLTIADNGKKYKIKKAGKACKITFKQACAFYGSHFRDDRGARRVIGPWHGKLSSFMVAPDNKPMVLLS